MSIPESSGRHGQADQQAPRRDRIAGAMSWPANCLIEGFAAYGHAFYPSSTTREEKEDSGDRRWNEGVQPLHEVALLRNNPWLCEDLREPAEQETRPMVPQGGMC